MKPLTGIRVLDLTNVLAGPFCTHQLTHMGAEVIKIELPGTGDLARQLGMDEDLSAQNMGISFLAPNPGKKSLTLNLKSEQGRAILHRLLAGADVLVENFRPGVMDRLGLGYDVLKSHNPALIYCAISGFGQTGPHKNRPAYDQIIQGLSGGMSVTGDATSAPLRAGWPIADTVGGLTAAMAICAALNAPERGTMIDVAMLDSLIATMGWAVSNLLIGGIAPVPAGNENLTSAPSAAYHCRDALLNIAANKQEQWEMLATHLGLPHLIDDPRFATRFDRRTHRQALNTALEQVLRTRDAAIWEAELNRLGVPAGRVLTVQQALEDPQYVGRDQIETHTLPNGRTIRSLRTGLHLDGAPLGTETPPPTLGQHNAEILEELGFTGEEIDALRRNDVI